MTEKGVYFSSEIQEQIYHTFSRHLARPEVCESVRYVIVRNTSTLWQFGTTRN